MTCDVDALVQVERPGPYNHPTVIDRDTLSVDRGHGVEFVIPESVTIDAKIFRDSHRVTNS